MQLVALPRHGLGVIVQIRSDSQSRIRLGLDFKADVERRTYYKLQMADIGHKRPPIVVDCFLNMRCQHLFR